MKFNLYLYLLILLLWTALGAPAFSQANENLLLATRLMQEHRYEEALPVLKELNKKEPENYSYSTLLTDCLIQLKQYDEALKVVRRFDEHPVYAGQAQIRIGEL